MSEKLPFATKGAPTDVDRVVGQKIRQKRILRGWSQERLAEALGVTFQQLQKYESGANRVAASRLFDLARLFDCTVDDFFEWTRPKSVSVSFRFVIDQQGRIVSLDKQLAPADARPYAAFSVNVELQDGEGL